MKINYEWIQDYFAEKLPPAERLTHELIFHSFEVEEGGKSEDVVEVDVLPNRAHDCLCHRGIAKELSVLFQLPLKRDPLREALPHIPASSLVEVNIEEPKLCRRYAAVVVKGIKVKESPEWLVKRLASIGQKSINNVVDAANYVMFDLGQPLHAFDMAKLAGKGGKQVLSVRRGKKGEKMVSLDDVEYAVGEQDLLIVDGSRDAPIGIAGVKGGKVSGIDEKTTDIVIESANFNPVSVRRTSQRLKLRTDASTRFENEPSAELVPYGLAAAAKLVIDLAGGEIEGLVDVYPSPQKERTVRVSLPEINELLGTDMSEGDVEGVLACFEWEWKKEKDMYVVVPPFERLDLLIREDLIEEIGRVYGYENITAIVPEPLRTELEVNKRFYYAEKVRDVLVGLGFSEVYMYSLGNRGEVETANPLASDKGALREDLSDGITGALLFNIRNADLLGLDQIKIFEMGTVFRKTGEYTSFAMGVKNPQGFKGARGSEALKEAADAVEKTLGVKLPAVSGEVYEINFDETIEKLPTPRLYDISYTSVEESKAVKYKPFSVFPFVLRDIAVWVPEGVKPEEVHDLIKGDAGELLVNSRLFDEYKENGRISYAFRLVFQSYERTLTDAEVNKIMEKIAASIHSRESWKVR